MSIIYVLIPIAMIFVLIAVGLFFWAVKSEQFDDLERQSLSILFDDAPASVPLDETDAAVAPGQEESSKPAPQIADAKLP